MTVTVSTPVDLMLPPLCPRHKSQLWGTWNRPETWECGACTVERENLCNAVDALLEFVNQYDGIGDDLFQYRTSRELVAAVRARK